jgi:hypothetical protein
MMPYCIVCVSVLTSKEYVVLEYRLCVFWTRIQGFNTAVILLPSLITGCGASSGAGPRPVRDLGRQASTHLKVSDEPQK